MPLKLGGGGSKNVEFGVFVEQWTDETLTLTGAATSDGHGDFSDYSWIPEGGIKRSLMTSMSAVGSIYFNGTSFEMWNGYERISLTFSYGEFEPVTVELDFENGQYRGSTNSEVQAIFTAAIGDWLQVSLLQVIIPPVPVPVEILDSKGNSSRPRKAKG
ncbi:hypothetical protein ACWONS_003506 [Vibrio parahaemolyticus]